ncbi:MAG TPA: amidohydrolase [Candidatus Hydrogenedentes bacterium]|nr:amidohydrolase [Candidatus Hydrogenedentota bacterium]
MSKDSSRRTQPGDKPVSKGASGGGKPAAAKQTSPPDMVRVALIGLVIMLVLGHIGTYAVFQAKLRRAETSTSLATRAPAASSDTRALGDYRIVNAHEHLFSGKYLDKYFEACANTGVVQTLFVASSDYTLKGSAGKPTEGNVENSQEMLRVAREFPDAVVPFVTMHPNDEDKVKRLREYVEQGAKGLKLYTGHGNFWDRPLDADEMLDVYAYCEQTDLPICWHVNLLRYPDEFSRVMMRFPKLKVIVPHFGVTFYRCTGKPWQLLQDLLDAYPGLYTDTSFGTRDILVAGLEMVSAYPEIFRAFFEKYQDRILWGTDMVVTGNREKTQPWVESVLLACRNVLEKDRYTFWMAARGSGYALERSENTYGELRGLALPDAILRKIYETNFARFMETE